MNNNNIVTYDELRQLTGYSRPTDISRTLRTQGIKVFMGKNGPWTTLALINRAGGLAGRGRWCRARRLQSEYLMRPPSRGRERRHNPRIPAHIDQARLPTGVYFDARGRGHWYTQYRDDTGRLRSQTIADSSATLAELGETMAQRTGVNHSTLGYLCEQFHRSAQFQALMPKTREGYDYCRRCVLEMPTQTGQRLGELTTARFSSPLIQRIIDKLAAAGTPTKANSLLRYLRRLFRWGINRGHCQQNPAQGVEAATERRRRRLPTECTFQTVMTYARNHGHDMPQRGQVGSCPAYLWMVMELAYLCRLRGIEVITLTDAHARPDGIMTNRRKGSRDNIVRWTPRLRKVWQAAQQRRAHLWAAASRRQPQRPDKRPLIVARDGEALQKSSLDSAWQRMMKRLVTARLILAEERFGLHDLKRKGITDTPGTRHDKQQASGHRSSEMMDVYDLSIPIVAPASPPLGNPSM